MRGHISRHRFRAMGTDVVLIGPFAGDDGSSRSPERDRPFARAVRAVQLEFRAQEERFSRFRPDSELSRVNRQAGAWTEVSQPFAEVLRFALLAAEETDGLFDPTVLPALLAAGYDRTIEAVKASPGREQPPPRWKGGFRDVQIQGLSVRVPACVALDFGGLAKGWTVDRAAEAAWAAVQDPETLPWVMVDAGGDLRLVGRPVAPLEVGVEDPFQPKQEALRLTLDQGALATSCVTGRARGEGRHHMIDPRTSRSARTGVAQATVWAETCAEAEVWAKWALLTGPAALGRVAAVLVMELGDVLVNVGASAREVVRT